MNDVPQSNGLPPGTSAADVPTSIRAAVFDGATGRWIAVNQGDYRDLASFSETNAAFFHFAGEDGWILVDGPSGAAGHAPNAGGFDGVAARIVNGELVIEIFDDKALTSSRVTSATALRENLEENLHKLDDLIQGSHFDDVPHIAGIRGQVADALISLETTNTLPGNVKLVITSYAGNVQSVGGSLADTVEMVGHDRSRAPIPSQDLGPVGQGYLARNPDGMFADLVRQRLGDAAHAEDIASSVPHSPPSPGQTPASLPQSWVDTDHDRLIDQMAPDGPKTSLAGIFTGGAVPTLDIDSKALTESFGQMLDDFVDMARSGPTRAGMKVVPVLGWVSGAYSIADNVRNDRYGSAILDGVGFFPIVGDAVDGVRLGGQAQEMGAMDYLLTKPLNFAADIAFGSGIGASELLNELPGGNVVDPRGVREMEELRDEVKSFVSRMTDTPNLIVDLEERFNDVFRDTSGDDNENQSNEADDEAETGGGTRAAPGNSAESETDNDTDTDGNATAAPDNSAEPEGAPTTSVEVGPITVTPSEANDETETDNDTRPAPDNSAEPETDKPEADGNAAAGSEAAPTASIEVGPITVTPNETDDEPETNDGTEAGGNATAEPENSAQPEAPPTTSVEIGPITVTPNAPGDGGPGDGDPPEDGTRQEPDDCRPGGGTDPETGGPIINICGPDPEAQARLEGREEPDVADRSNNTSDASADDDDGSEEPDIVNRDSNVSDDARGSHEEPDIVSSDENVQDRQSSEDVSAPADTHDASHADVAAPQGN